MTPALSHLLTFAVPAPFIAACDRCGYQFKHLADVATPCLPEKEIKSCG